MVACDKDLHLQKLSSFRNLLLVLLLFLFLLLLFYSILFFYRPEIFNGLLQRLLFYKANKLASSNAESANQLLERLLANIQRVYDSEYQLNRHQIIRMLIDIKPCKHMSYCNSESGQSSRWVSLDIYMENAMDGKQLHIRPSVAILTGDSFEEILIWSLV